MNTFLKAKYSLRALVLCENFALKNITTKNLLPSIKFLVRFVKGPERDQPTGFLSLIIFRLVSSQTT
jgi:hypothetical protein